MKCLGDIGIPRWPKRGEFVKCDPTREFQCANGACIYWTKLCNGVPDCLDGSDERISSNHWCEKPPCPGDPVDYWRCANKKQCITAAHKCDGDIHCSDESDEWNCENRTATVQ